MHTACWDYVEQLASKLDPELHSTFLEIGALDVNGSVRHFFPWAKSYTGLDIVDGPGVDIVADAATWKPEEEYDVVISTEVLEHAPRWRDIVHTMYKALRPGGVFILTCATTGRGAHNAHGASVINEEEEYYKNVGLAEFAVEIQKLFAEVALYSTCGSDLQCWGVKRIEGIAPCDTPGILWRPRS